MGGHSVAAKPVFGGGGLPGHPVFRPYNLLLLVIAVLLILGLFALRVRYTGRYGWLGTVRVAVTLVGYALLLVGSIPAVLLPGNGPTGLIMAGQDLGFVGALVSGAGAILLVVALPVGIVGAVLVSAIGFVDIAGLPLTVLYGGAWVTLGSQLWSQGSTATQPSRVG
jgi:hypothetical protein